MKNFLLLLASVLSSSKRLILLNLCFSSKIFWASLLLINLTIILPVSPNLWEATYAQCLYYHSQLLENYNDMFFEKVDCDTFRDSCNFDAFTMQVLFKSIPFHFDDSVERAIEVFSAIITLLWKVSFSFFRSSNLLWHQIVLHFHSRVYKLLIGHFS